MSESVRILATAGTISAGLAAWAWIADYLRARRRNPDRVGFMPWTTIFVIAMFAGVLLLGAATREALS